MKCPACHRQLTELKVGPVILDACQQGCGGIWLDAQELDRINQTIPAVAPLFAEVERAVGIQVDEKRVRQCVRCSGAKLERKLFSLGTGVIMDCCPKCSGIWLDYGELETIREETNPKPRPVRHVVARSVPSQRIPITFGLVQQVQILRVQK
mgnify:CR=1 FL=1